MTIVQSMLFHRVCVAMPGLPLIALCAMLGACTSTNPRHALTPPEVLTSPYDSVKGDALWAVVPLVNESGVSFADTLALSDTLVQVITETRGLTCVPMNRTLTALRAMGNRPINSPQAARMLANFMGVDGVVLGSITAYDPYDPPKIGLNLALFIRDTGRPEEVIDPIQMQAAFTDHTKTAPSQFLDRPASLASEHFDAASHDVQFELRRYGAGRTDPNSSLGWRSGLISMDMYSKFAAHQTLARLLEHERLRLAQISAPKADQPPPNATRDEHAFR